MLQIDNTTALVNLKSHTLETAPFIYDGRTLVPLRFISEALGAQVKWNGEQRSITLTVGQDTIVLVIGQSAARVNGKTVMMDVPAMIYNNTTMVPVRFVSEQLNQKKSPLTMKHEPFSSSVKTQQKPAMTIRCQPQTQLITLSANGTCGSRQAAMERAAEP